MTDLWTPLTSANPAAAPSKCRRHRWMLGVIPGEGIAWSCIRCGRIRDEAAYRRGRSARRLGGDQERGFQSEHGPTKIGQRGDPVDHLGGYGKYQVKSTRGSVPARYRLIDRMDGLYGDRTPMLVQRFVRPGVRTETYVTLRLRDLQAHLGRDEEPTT